MIQGKVDARIRRVGGVSILQSGVGDIYNYLFDLKGHYTKELLKTYNYYASGYVRTSFVL